MGARMKTATLDTGVLILALDDKPGANDTWVLLQWHRDGRLELHVSNRVFEHDTRRMDSAQVDALRALLGEFDVAIKGAAFRSDFSLLSGGDFLSGGPSVRTSEEMARFTKLVGKDPAEEYASSKSLSNKLGDYDALKEHFASGRNVFITTDKKHYLDVNRRPRYAEQLGLVILTPAEFVTQSAGLASPPASLHSRFALP